LYVLFSPCGVKKEHTNRTYAVGAFSLRQRGTSFLSVCGFSARSAEKPHTKGWLRTMLPQAKSAASSCGITQLRKS
jgi:hypothetical protein